MVRKVTVLDEEDDDEEQRNDCNNDLTIRKYDLDPDLDFNDDDIDNRNQSQNQSQSHCIDVIPMGQNHNQSNNQNQNQNMGLASGSGLNYIPPLSIPSSPPTPTATARTTKRPSLDFNFCNGIKLHILVVDDSKLNRKMLTKSLRSDGKTNDFRFERM